MERTRASSVVAIVKNNVATEMTRKTPYAVTPEMVTFVRGNAGNGVFVAHVDDNVTILCKIRGVGKLDIKTVSW